MKTRTLLVARITVGLVSALLLTLVLPRSISSVAAISSSTEVGGSITSDTIWTLAFSPYVVIEDIEVEEGVTLSIEPGVMVKFDGGNQLLVHGELVAQGTADQLVRFTSNRLVPAPGDWGNIEFTSTAVTTTMDAQGNYISGSVLQYCVVEYARGAVFSTTKSSAIYAHSLLIDHCIVWNNHARGIYDVGAVGAPARITNNVVSNNLATSSFSCSQAHGGGIYAVHSTVSGNIVNDNSILSYRYCDDVHGVGIYAADSIVSDNTVRRNIISGEAFMGHFILRAYGGGIYASGSTVRNNTVSDNSLFAYLYAYGGGIYALGGLVSDNIVSDNSTAGNNHICGGGIYASSSLVRDNFVRGNSTTASLAACGGGIYASGNSVSGNTVSGNSATAKYPGNGQGHGGGVYSSGSTVLTNTIVANAVAGDKAQGAGTYVLGSIHVLYNTLVSNSGPLSQSVGGLALDGPSQVHLNNVYGNEPYDIAVASSDDISGSHNYWGTITTADIPEQIYDRDEDSARGVFTYTPYLQNLSADAPFPPPIGLASNFDEAWSYITLSWDNSPDLTTESRYRVHYDTDSSLPPYIGTGLLLSHMGTDWIEVNSPIDVGDSISLTLAGLDPGQDYYFAVTAYDDDNEDRQSQYSGVMWKDGGYQVRLPIMFAAVQPMGLPDDVGPFIEDATCLGPHALALTFSESVKNAERAYYGIVSDGDENYQTVRLPVEVQYADPTHVVYLAPPWPLQAGRVYTVTVNGIVDSVGNPMLPNTVVSLVAISPTISIDAADVQRDIPPTLLGSNTALWNPASLAYPDVVDKVRASGITVLRFPGGSIADTYHWREHEPELGGSDVPWLVNTSESMAFASVTNVEPMLIANFGTGTAEEAADWVRFTNITHTWDVKYWEIGNEPYGLWEVTWTHNPTAYVWGDDTHDGANAFCQAMKAVDPTILVGVAGTKNELAHNNWGPIVLQEISECIDFYVVHYYGFGPGYSNYTGLLTAPYDASNSPASIAAAVRTMMDTHAPGREIGLAMTEYTSYWAQPGPHTVQTVHALFLADMLGQLVSSGYTYANHWDIINTTSPGGGSYGCLLVDKANYRQPSYYIFPLWSRFGDQLLKTDANLDPETTLSIYAGRQITTGHITLLAINKTGATITTTVTLSGTFSTGLVNVYTVRGESLDAASVAYNGIIDPPVDLGLVPPSSLTLSAARFEVGFPPYSVVLLEIPTTDSVFLPMMFKTRV